MGMLLVGKSFGERKACGRCSTSHAVSGQKRESCRISLEEKRSFVGLSGLAEFLTFAQTFLTIASHLGKSEIVKYLLSLPEINIDKVHSLCW